MFGFKFKYLLTPLFAETLNYPSLASAIVTNTIVALTVLYMMRYY